MPGGGIDAMHLHSVRTYITLAEVPGGGIDAMHLHIVFFFLYEVYSVVR